MHLPLVGEVLGGGEREAGGNDALDGGVVRQIEEKRDALHGAVLLEVRAEETGDLHVDAHRAEDDGEVLLGVVVDVLALDQRGLAADLRADLVVRQPVGGEERDLLPARDGVHHVDGRNARLDHFLRINTLVGVDRHALNVEEVLGEHGRPVVDRRARAVEGTAQHLVGNGHLERRARELAVGVEIVDATGAFENLDHGAFALDLEDLTLAGRPV